MNLPLDIILVIFDNLEVNSLYALACISKGMVNASINRLNKLALQDEDTLQHLIARKRNQKLFELVLRQKNLDLNMIDWRRETSLVVAIQEENKDMVKFLLNSGADPLLSIREGLSETMTLAIKRHNRSIIQSLTDSPDLKAKCQDALKMVTVEAHDHDEIPKMIKMIEMLLEYFDSSLYDSDQLISLHSAASRPLPKCLALYLEKTKNVSVQDRDGRTALHRAIEFYPGNIKLRIDADVDSMIKDNREYTALDMIERILNESYTPIDCEEFIKRYNKMLHGAHDVLLQKWEVEGPKLDPVSLRYLGGEVAEKMLNDKSTGRLIYRFFKN